MRVEQRRAHFLALCLLLAAACADFYFAVGLRVLDPSNLSWMRGDPAEQQIAWDFLRREAQWHFPPSWTNSLGYPIGVSVAFTDSIPLLAIAFRAIAPLLPEPFQYLGMFLLAGCILQAYFAYSLFLKLLNRDVALAAVSALFVLFAPAFTSRIFMAHFALGAHWLILAALSSYFDDRIERGNWRYLLPFAVLLFLAGTINPYLLFMTFLIALAALGRLSLEGRGRLMPLAGMAALLVAISLAAAILVGFLFQGGQLAGWGYGYYSMNLLSPIDPQGGDALLLNPQPIFPGQYEGNNYLGLGILAMLLLGLGLGLKRATLLDSRVLPLLAVFMISTLLALSTKATAGHWIIYDLPLPDVAHDALASLRASGRLFWPAHYLAIVAAVVLVCKSMPRRRAFLVLIALLLVQALDIAPSHARLHNIWANLRTPTPLASGDWSELGSRHAHLVVIPPTECDPDGTPGAQDGPAIFGRLALSQGMTVNSYYAGRSDARSFQYFCRDLPKEILASGLAADSAYVVNPAFMAQLLSAGTPLNQHYCRAVDGFLLCARAPGHAGVDESLARQIQAGRR